MNDTLLYIILFILFIWCSSLSGEFHSLKKRLKEDNMLKEHGDKVKNLLAKNIGKQMFLKFDDDNTDIDLLSTPCEIVDVDEKWVLVRYTSGKKTKEKLIRLSVLEGAKYKQ
ncbi:MAG: hypothetical protein J6K04_09470 [Lachnospiraceae bacterium]|nr:hypothetical protein [Lachnospiraceae bacterium]